MNCVTRFWSYFLNSVLVPFLSMWQSTIIKSTYRRVYLRLTVLENEAMTIMVGSVAAGRQASGAVAESLHPETEISCRDN